MHTMNQTKLIGVLLMMTLVGKSKQGNSFARDYELDAASVANKRPRNVDTVARQDYLRLRGLRPDVPGLINPDEADTKLLDVSSVDVGHGGMLPGRDAHWSLWSDWSTCSSSCGGGVSSRARRCISRQSAKTDLLCHGSSTEHKICETKKCSTGSQDFREMQCSRQNGKVILSRNFKWIPFSGKGGNSCELSCMATNFHFYHSFGAALDGTRCGTGRKGICIKGECMNVGCDGEIGSNATEDACGVCGGNNGTCYHHQNVVDRLPGNGELNSDYNKVATIPIGATHIRVKDHNKNYLVLAEDNDGKVNYIVNGNWVVSWPGEYKAAGTVATYGRLKDKETFDIVGPTTKELNIMVLCLGKQPLIEYDYWMPNSEEDLADGMAEFKAQRKTVIHVPDEEDYRNQIIAAGLDFDAVKPPTLPTTTTISTTTLTTTTIVTTRKKPTYRRPSVRPSHCTTCKKSINKKKRFCESDFVIHVRILPKRRLQRGRYIRYEVEILNNYKSKLRMMRREYIWVSSTCCPRLRPYRHYLLMGRSVKVGVANAVRTYSDQGRQPETRLLLDHSEFWYTWKKYQIRMARAVKNINCKRYRYLAAKFYRRKLNEG